MRIISPFKDVYDLQHSMRDDSQTWNRKTEEIQVKGTEALSHYFTAHLPTERRRRGSGYNILVEPMFLAGQVHYLYTIKEGGELPDAQWETLAPVIHEDFLTFNPNKCVERLEELGVVDISSRFTWGSDSSLDKAFAKIVGMIEGSYKERATKMLEELRVPLALVKGYSGNILADSLLWDISINFCFNDLRLPWHEIEPNLYILHQQLQQYIFGVLGTEAAEMVSISDKDRLVAHGFSNTTSFRNMVRD